MSDDLECKFSWWHPTETPIVTAWIEPFLSDCPPDEAYALGIDDAERCEAFADEVAPGVSDERWRCISNWIAIAESELSPQAARVFRLMYKPVQGLDVPMDVPDIEVLRRLSPDGRPIGFCRYQFSGYGLKKGEVLTVDYDVIIELISRALLSPSMIMSDIPHQLSQTGIGVETYNSWKRHGSDRRRAMPKPKWFNKLLKPEID